MVFRMLCLRCCGGGCSGGVADCRRCGGDGWACCLLFVPNFRVTGLIILLGNCAVLRCCFSNVVPVLSSRQRIRFLEPTTPLAPRINLGALVLSVWLVRVWLILWHRWKLVLHLGTHVHHVRNWYSLTRNRNRWKERVCVVLRVLFKSNNTC